MVIQLYAWNDIHTALTNVSSKQMSFGLFLLWFATDLAWSGEVNIAMVPPRTHQTSFLPVHIDISAVPSQTRSLSHLSP